MLNRNICVDNLLRNPLVTDVFIPTWVNAWCRDLGRMRNGSLLVTGHG